jgi:hypothetical protein
MHHPFSTFTFASASSFAREGGFAFVAICDHLRIRTGSQLRSIVQHLDRKIQGIVRGFRKLYRLLVTYSVSTG